MAVDANTTVYANSDIPARVDAKVFYVESPSGSKSYPLAGIPEGARILALRHIVDSGTVDFNVEIRAQTTPFTTSTTKLFSSNKTAGTTSIEETVFANNLSPGKDLHYVEASTTGSPTKLKLKVVYAI